MNNWMKNLNETVPDFKSRRLSDIMIPGTNCSACNRFDFLSERTQDLSLYQQLQNGIRYLSLSFYYDDNDFYIINRHIYGFQKLQNIIKQINLFLSENPSEVVILHINQLSNFTNNTTYEKLYGILFENFSVNFVKESGLNELPLIDSLIKQQKSLILSVNSLYKPKIYEPFLWNEITVPYDEKVYTSNNPDIVKKFIEKQFEKFRSQLWVAQVTMEDPLQKSFRYFKARSLANQMNQGLDTWIKTPEWRSSANIITSNFTTRPLIQSIVGQNRLGKRAYSTSTRQAGYSFFNKKVLNSMAKAATVLRNAHP